MPRAPPRWWSGCSFPGSWSGAEKYADSIPIPIRPGAPRPLSISRDERQAMTTVTTVTAVTGGTVVTPDGVRAADVLISDGRIAAVGESAAATGPDTVNAAGCYVLPGGVDPHCHLMAQVALATAAAAREGTTTALSFTNPGPGQGDLQS